MSRDRFLTKTLTTGGAATTSEYFVGPIVDGGSSVDEWDLGLLSGSEVLYLCINVTTYVATESFSPIFSTDDNTSKDSLVTKWTAPVAIAAAGLYCYRLPAIRERYGYLATGTITNGTAGAMTMAAWITPDVPTGRLT
jgi:hypothetical protein